MIFLDPLATVGKQYILKNSVLGSGVLGGVAVSVVILIVWTVVEDIRLQSIYVAKDAIFGYQYGWVQVDRCVSNSGKMIFPLLSAAIHVVMECVLIYVAYTARKVMPLFNESRLIFTVSFFWLICTITFVAIEMSVPLIPDALIAIQSTRTFLPVTVTVLLMHIPNAAKIITDPLGPLVNFAGLFSSRRGFTSSNGSSNNGGGIVSKNSGRGTASKNSSAPSVGSKFRTTNTSNSKGSNSKGSSSHISMESNNKEKKPIDI